jgi:predicted Fe-Mo cluster-binding NifX family protein
MRFAIPLIDGRLCAHFGHCARFALIDADIETKTILSKEEVDAPEHQPGLLPGWLADRGANVVVAGGMGPHAQGLFTEHGIEVVVGVPSREPEPLVQAYLAGTLEAGENICDH